MITEKESRDLFEKLNDGDKKIVVNNLINMRNDYLRSGGRFDLPYFFWSLNRGIFEGEDVTEFLDINNGNDFGIQAIYYLSKYILAKRG